MSEIETYDQYFLSYSGTKLPLNLVNPLSPEEIHNRNTYFGVNLDDQGRIALIHKRVYGEIELTHHYGYDAAGHLSWAEIHAIDDEARKLLFDASGAIIDEQEISTP